MCIKNYQIMMHIYVICTHTCIHISIHNHKNIYTYLHTCVYIYKYMYTCRCMYTATRVQVWRVRSLGSSKLDLRSVLSGIGRLRKLLSWQSHSRNILKRVFWNWVRVDYTHIPQYLHTCSDPSPRSIAGVPFDSGRRFRASLWPHTTCVLAVWWHNMKKKN